MLVKTKTYVYLDCECGKALKYRVTDGFSEDYTVVVEPCSCLLDAWLQKQGEIDESGLE